MCVPQKPIAEKKAQEEITDWLIHRELLNITNHIPDTPSLLHWLITTFPDISSSIQRDEIMKWQKAIAPSKKIKFKGNAVKFPNDRYKTIISYRRYKTPKLTEDIRPQNVEENTEKSLPLTASPCLQLRADKGSCWAPHFRAFAIRWCWPLNGTSKTGVNIPVIAAPSLQQQQIPPFGAQHRTGHACRNNPCT